MKKTYLKPKMGVQEDFCIALLNSVSGNFTEGETEEQPIQPGTIDGGNAWSRQRLGLWEEEEEDW